MSAFEDEFEEARERFHKRLADTFEDMAQTMEHLDKKYPSEQARVRKEKQGWQAVSDWLGDPERALTHVGGRGHGDHGYSGGTVCWCGQEHGVHNQLGGATCWCGAFNAGVGTPR